MKTTIQDKLKEIEKDKGIKILYACESGSRAWGFPSPDSDYDIRFIYQKDLASYLFVNEKEKQISLPIVGDLDIYGWDLKKVLQLIGKSNTTPFEWLQSPIIYVENSFFKDSLWKLCPSYFDPKSNIYHYLGMARGAMETIKEDEIKIKKLFYVLRPLLAALWCVERKTIAPMAILPLMDLLSDKLQKKIIHLIELKSTVNENYVVKLDSLLQDWIRETFDRCMIEAQIMKKQYLDEKQLDTFFQKTVLK